MVVFRAIIRADAFAGHQQSVPFFRCFRAAITWQDMRNLNALFCGQVHQEERNALREDLGVHLAGTLGAVSV